MYWKQKRSCVCIIYFSFKNMRQQMDLIILDFSINKYILKRSLRISVWNDTEKNHNFNKSFRTRIKPDKNSCPQDPCIDKIISAFGAAHQQEIIVIVRLCVSVKAKIDISISTTQNDRKIYFIILSYTDSTSTCV